MTKAVASAELGLLKLLLNYKRYQEYHKYIEIPQGFREIKILYHTLDLLHTRYPDVDKSIDDLAVMLSMAYPRMQDIEKSAIDALLQQTRLLNIDKNLILDLLKQIQIRSDAQTLAIASLEVAEGKRTVDSIQPLFKRLSDEDEDTRQFGILERNFVTDDLTELANHSIMGPGVSWPLACLNQSLGPLRVGDFGFVFARPESGKTTFLAHACTHMAGQTTGPIIWFNNEEQGQKVRLRMYQAALGLRNDELWKDKAKAMQEYRKITKGQLHLYDDKTIHKNDVEIIISRKKPSLVVFDQIDKIKGFKADRPDLVYGQIYQWARELAKNQCAIIGICQSDGAGEGVRWLTMSHVAEAKTSKQAEADWILGIGKSHEANTEDIRYLNISKNKLLGDKHTDPSLRHGRFEVFLKPQIARYEDI